MSDQWPEHQPLDASASPEQRILAATVDVIEDVGLQALTVRGIAERAGVNPAAINYYFRSKDRLIAMVLEYTLFNAFGDIGDFVPDGPITDPAPLKRYFQHIVWGMTKYPGIVRAHFAEPWSNRNYDTPAIRRLNEFLEDLFQRLEPGCPPARRETLRLNILQFECSLLMFGLTAEGFSRYAGSSVTDEEYQQQFVSHLVDTMIAPYIGPPNHY